MLLDGERVFDDAGPRTNAERGALRARPRPADPHRAVARRRRAARGRPGPRARSAARLPAPLGPSSAHVAPAAAAAVEPRPARGPLTPRGWASRAGAVVRPRSPRHASRPAWSSRRSPHRAPRPARSPRRARGAAARTQSSRCATTGWGRRRAGARLVAAARALGVIVGVRVVVVDQPRGGSALLALALARSGSLGARDDERAGRRPPARRRARA